MEMLNAVTGRVRLQGRFPCSPQGARGARKLIADFSRAWVADEMLAALELACGEALANSVEHGGGPALDVACSFADDEMTVEIRHEGKGFDPPPMVAAPPQGSLRGYGLYIMHEMLDRVEYLDGGTGLRLRMKLTR